MTRQRQDRERIAAMSALTHLTFLVLVTMLVLAQAGCAPSLDFRRYRACLERSTSMVHDVGTVVWEELGDEGARHFGFWPDRLRDDPRQVIDVAASHGVRMNRFCVLVTGNAQGSNFGGVQR